MILEIPYGDGFETVELDDRNVEQVIAPNTVQVGEERNVLGEALDHPLGSSSLDDFIRDSRRILLVVNDATRPTPTRAILEMVYPVLRERDLQIIVATGSHRARPPRNAGPFSGGTIFSIMTVPDSRHRIFAAAAGELRKTFRRLIKKADTVYVVPIRNRAEIVVTIARPPTSTCISRIKPWRTATQPSKRGES